MPRALSPRHRKFLSLYLGECNFNASESARRCGYPHPAQSGFAVLKRINKHLSLSDILRRHAMSPEEMIARISDIARGSLDDFVTVDPITGGVFIDMRKAVERNVMHTFDTVEYTDKGRLKIRRHNALDALYKLAQIYKMAEEQETQVDVRTLNIYLSALPPDVAEEARRALSRTLGEQGPQAGRTIDVGPEDHLG